MVSFDRISSSSSSSSSSFMHQIDDCFIREVVNIFISSCVHIFIHQEREDELLIRNYHQGEESGN